MTMVEFVTLTRFFASGTAGGFNSDVKIMKMISKTSSTSVNGVMLIVDITSSSGADPTTDITFAFSLALFGHEPDVIVAGFARSVQDLDDGVVARIRVCDQRNVRGVALIGVRAVKGDGA